MASDARARAWATRRAQYGPRGHSGAYTRWAPLRESLMRRALKLIVKLHLDGTLSEGQACRALNVGRVEWRTLVDDERLRTGIEYVEATDA